MLIHGSAIVFTSSKTSNAHRARCMKHILSIMELVSRFKNRYFVNHLNETTSK